MEEQIQSILQEAEVKIDNAQSLAASGEYDEALRIIDQAESAFESIQHITWLTFTRHEKLRILLERGSTGNTEKLVDEIKKGYHQTKNHKGLALLLIHESILFNLMEDYISAIANLRLAETLIVEKSMDTLKGYLYATIANNYIETQDFIRAIDSLEESIANYSTVSESGEKIWCFWRLAECYRNIYQFKEAEKCYMAAYKGYLHLNDMEAGKRVLIELRDWYIERQSGDKTSEIEEILTSLKE